MAVAGGRDIIIMYEKPKRHGHLEHSVGQKCFCALDISLAGDESAALRW